MAVTNGNCVTWKWLVSVMAAAGLGIGTLVWGSAQHETIQDNKIERNHEYIVELRVENSKLRNEILDKLDKVLEER